jgi:cytochrome b561
MQNRIRVTADGGEGYSSVAKLLHWAVAGAIVVQYVLANLADNAGTRFSEFVLLANHKSVGITILVLALLRLGWRFAVPPPPPLPMPSWQRVSSVLSHGAFYLLIILMPVSGWLMSSASNFPVSWFNLFQLPDLVAPNEGLAEVFEETHEAMAKILFLLALLHVAAALKHKFVDRDTALQRISSPAALGLFLIIVIAGVLLLTPDSRAGETAPAWRIDMEKSHIRFVAEQAGATFEGSWSDWHAELRFDPSDPDGGSFDVEIRVAGVITGDKDRDDTLQDPEFFAAAEYPVVRYTATAFDKLPDGSFVARGSLDVKGRRNPAPLAFTVESGNGRRILRGSARLDRLALGIGTGEWEDTAWIGQFVDVKVHVEAPPAD